MSIAASTPPAPAAPATPGTAGSTTGASPSGPASPPSGRGARSPGVHTAQRVRARLLGVDATRGVALIGMIAVHSLYESDAAGHPTLAFTLFGGRASAAFAVLAGVGIAFMTGRRRVRLRGGAPVAAALLARALAVGVIGLALGELTDAALGACILPYYAVLFFLAIPLVYLPTWLIGVAGVGLGGGMPVLTHLWLPHLPVATLNNPVFADVAQRPLWLLSELALTGEYPALPWLAYVCVGLIVGRLNLARVRTAIGLLVTGVALAAGAVGASWVLLQDFGGLAKIWAAQPVSILTIPETTEMLTLGGDGTTPDSSWWWLAIDAPHTSTPADLIGTSGSAIALLGLFLLIGRTGGLWPARFARWTLSPLAGAGSMTLTLYTAHLLFINSQYDVYDANTGYALQVATALLIGMGWRATAGRGPLESLVTGVANRARRLAGGTSPRRPNTPRRAGAAA